VSFSERDVGGVHVKYLYHCPRQLWLYLHGYRPEAASDLVSLGEAIDSTSFSRRRALDLGEARIDWVEGRAEVHEAKSSRAPSDAHLAQVRLYCDALERRGVVVRGAVVHYPLVRRTVRLAWDDGARAGARDDRGRVVSVSAMPKAPPRLERRLCRGCSYADYCWGDA
jgi:CRISPR-associated exonuclease Cas4